jgi:hypothetical protein
MPLELENARIFISFQKIQRIAKDYNAIIGAWWSLKVGIRQVSCLPGSDPTGLPFSDDCRVLLVRQRGAVFPEIRANAVNLNKSQSNPSVPLLLPISR